MHGPEDRVKKFLVAALACSLLTVAPAFADDASKQATIRKLIEVTGAAQMGKQVMDTLFQQVKPLYPSVPGELWDELASLFTPGEMVELVVPIYDKHFDQEELEALLAFYESPTGRKLLSKMPAVMQESVGVGNAWGQKKALELMKRLTERGFKPVEA
jgi:hypothetical protein